MLVWAEACWRRAEGVVYEADQTLQFVARRCIWSQRGDGHKGFLCTCGLCDTVSGLQHC